VLNVSIFDEFRVGGHEKLQGKTALSHNRE